MKSHSVECDVAVVGSGVSGALLAARLSKTGTSVCLIEAGSRVNRQAAVQRFRSRARADIGTTYPTPEWAGRPDATDLSGYYLQSGPDLFSGIYDRQQGGSTWHWLGTCLRLLEADFRMHTRYGVGVDWPIGLADLAPYYAGAERELGVSGPAGPLPALPLTRVDQAVSQALEQLGQSLESLPQARNSVSYAGRPACCGSGSCVPICPIGAKYDASVHVEQARKQGAMILGETVVTRLRIGEGRVQELQALRSDRSPVSIRARRVVLAANAIETPRLLLMSRLHHPLLGRHLMGVTSQISWGLAAEPVYPHGGPQTVGGYLGARDGAFRNQRAGYYLNVVSDGWPDSYDLVEDLTAQGLWGAELAARVRYERIRQLTLVSTCEQLPDPDNRIELDPEFPDPLGLPRPRLHFHQQPYTRRGQASARDHHQQIFEALKAERIQHAPDALDPSHILGTCRMGKDPSTSLVDPSLRWHTLENLWLVGGAVFPTCGAAPPTLTMAALALRLASDLSEM